MNGIWVALSKPVSNEVIRQTLVRWFPLSAACTQAEAYELKDEWPPIVFAVTNTTAEDFPVTIGFDAFPGDPSIAQSVSSALGRKFALEFQCRSLCEAPGLADDGSPYWSLLWDNGESFLADDCNSKVFDGEGGDVRVVRKIQVALVELDLAAAVVEGPDDIKRCFGTKGSQVQILSPRQIEARSFQGVIQGLRGLRALSLVPVGRDVGVGVPEDLLHHRQRHLGLEHQRGRRVPSIVKPGWPGNGLHPSRSGRRWRYRSLAHYAAGSEV